MRQAPAIAPSPLPASSVASSAAAPASGDFGLALLQALQTILATPGATGEATTTDLLIPQTFNHLPLSANAPNIDLAPDQIVTPAPVAFDFATLLPLSIDGIETPANDQHKTIESNDLEQIKAIIDYLGAPSSPPSVGDGIELDPVGDLEPSADTGSSTDVTETQVSIAEAFLASQVVVTTPAPASVDSSLRNVIDARTQTEAPLKLQMTGSTSTLNPGLALVPDDLTPGLTREIPVPIRVLADRFSRYWEETAKPGETAPSLSALTPTELNAPHASVADRNATALARLDRFEFVDRIARALEQANARTPSRIDLELDPPSLGRVHIQVVNVDGTLTARIETSTATARSLICEQLPVLGRHLEQQGIQFQRFEVQYAAANVAGGNWSSGNGQSGQPNERNRRSHSPSTEQVDEIGEPGRGLTMGDLLAVAPGMDRVI